MKPLWTTLGIAALVATLPFVVVSSFHPAQAEGFPFAELLSKAGHCTIYRVDDRYSHVYVTQEDDGVTQCALTATGH